jgi:hypothetical protein
MKDEIRANSEKFEVLQGTLISLMDAHYARTEANQKEIMAKLDFPSWKDESLCEYLSRSDGGLSRKDGDKSIGSEVCGDA